MCERVPFPFVKDVTKSTTTISTSCKLRAGTSTPPSINNDLQEYPHYIYKVPVQYPEVYCNTVIWCSRRLQDLANTLIKESNNNVESVESSSQIECASKNRITKCKCRSCVLEILAPYEELSKQNSQPQLLTTNIFLTSRERMLRRIGGEITGK